MRVEVVSGQSLEPGEVERWGELQQQSLYSSPFFRPEFTAAMATMRDVRVAVIADAGAVAGFFPFEARARAGRPVAWPRSNYHGPVLDKRAGVDPRELVRACGLATWTFDHLPAQLPGYRRHSFGCGRSPYLDVSEGFEAYVASRRERSDVRNALGKTARKLAREIGPVRFVPESDAIELLDRLIDWKRRQYAETGVRDVLADAGSRELLERMHAVRGPEFAGALSVLYAGNEVAALQFGVRTASVWHCWFPAYNRDLAKYSPGLILLLELARAAASLGVRQVDLGKGDAPYKLALANGSHELLEGCVGASPVSALAVRGRESARHALRTAGVHRAVRRAIHRIRP